MNRDVCEHSTPVDLPCDKCNADELTAAYMMGAHSRLRTLNDEIIAELWYKNGTHHHHFARAIERWIKGNGKY